MSHFGLISRSLSRHYKQFAFLSFDKIGGFKYYLVNGTKTSHYSTAAQPITLEDAKPFEEIPTLSGLKSLIGFLPGGKYYNRDMNEIMAIMFEEYGDIIHLPGTLGKPTFIITQNPDDIETVFRHDGVWPERKGFETLDHYRNVYKKEFFGERSGLLTTQNKEWGDFRSIVNPVVIHPKNIRTYLPIMSKVNQEFIERIKSIRDPKTLEMPENFKNEISCWTLESVSVVALDKQLGLIKGDNEEAKKFFQSLQDFFDHAVELEVKPSLWRYFETNRLKAAMKTLDDMTEFCEKNVNEAIKRIENSSEEKADHEKSVLEKLLKIDKKVATLMAMDMLFAGVDTTTTTFTGLLLCLAKNPDKQEILRQEVLKILPQKDSPLTEENMKNMPYLRASIKEALRIYPLTNANARTLQQDLVLSGYRVPKGNQVALIYMNMLKDPEFYSEPNKFLPERWLRQNKNEAACPHAPTKSKHPFVYLPFGFGPRSCIGRRIAEMEMEIGTARIIRNFHIEFNYPSDKAFRMLQIHVPNIPLKFKFTDLNY